MSYAASGSGDIDTLRTDVAVASLRDALKDGWSVLALAAGIADALVDQTGIGALGGATYDAAGNYLHNTGGYVNISQGKTVTATPAGGGGGNPASWIVDGTTTGTGGGANGGTMVSFAWGATLDIDLGIAAIPARLVLHQCSNAYATAIAFYYSDNGSAWTQATTASGGIGNVNTWDFTGLTSHRYWRVRETAHQDSGPGSWFLPELQLFSLNAAADVATVSAAYTAEAVTSSVRVVALHQAIDATTIGTDCLLDVSADGGTNWTTVALADLGKYDGTTRIIGALAAVTAGTSLKWRWRTANGKTQYLHAIYLQWR